MFEEYFGKRIEKSQGLLSVLLPAKYAAVLA